MCPRAGHNCFTNTSCSENEPCRNELKSKMCILVFIFIKQNISSAKNPPKLEHLTCEKCTLVKNNNNIIANLKLELEICASTYLRQFRFLVTTAFLCIYKYFTTVSALSHSIHRTGFTICMSKLQPL